MWCSSDRIQSYQSSRQTGSRRRPMGLILVSRVILTTLYVNTPLTSYVSSYKNSLCSPVKWNVLWNIAASLEFVQPHVFTHQKPVVKKLYGENGAGFTNAVRWWRHYLSDNNAMSQRKDWRRPGNTWKELWRKKCGEWVPVGQLMEEDWGCGIRHECGLRSTGSDKA